MRKVWHWISLTDYRLTGWLVLWMMIAQAARSDEPGNVYVPGEWGWRRWPKTVCIWGQSNWNVQHAWHQVPLVHHDLRALLHSSILAAIKRIKGDLRYWLIGFAVWFSFNAKPLNQTIAELRERKGKGKGKGGFGDDSFFSDKVQRQASWHQ